MNHMSIHSLNSYSFQGREKEIMYTLMLKFRKYKRFFLTIEFYAVCYEGCKTLGFLLPKPHCLPSVWNL